MFHDIVWQVWGNRVSLLAGQIVHRSLILVVQHENLGNQLQLFHFGRIAAVLLDVGQIGRSVSVELSVATPHNFAIRVVGMPDFLTVKAATLTAYYLA